MLHVNVATLTLALVLASVVFGNDGSAQEDSPKARASRSALDAWLARIPNAKAGTVAPVDDPAIRNILPDEHFYTVRFFVGYPRPGLVPRPLGLNNLILVRSDGSVKQIKNLTTLTRLFTEKLPPILDEKQAREAVLAYLRLTEEFYQDGQYVFSIPEDSIVVARQGAHLVASGRAVVTKGGNGELTAKLMFDASGKVSMIEPGGRTRPDVRLR